MNNIINAQTSAKTYLKRVTMIATIVLVLSITLSNVDAVPNKSNDKETTCKSTGKESANGLEIVECCWFDFVKPGTGFGGGSVEEYCSECEDGGSRGKINCSEPELQYRTGPTTDESVFPNDDSNAIDEQQPNPSSPLTDQRVPPGNVGVLEQLEDSSNNQNSESADTNPSNPGLMNVVPQNPTVSEPQTAEDSNNENLPQDSGAQR
ncbi:hypothetical protein [Candidatus Nitrosocosmicus sp. T]